MGTPYDGTGPDPEDEPGDPAPLLPGRAVRLFWAPLLLLLLGWGARVHGVVLPGFPLRIPYFRPSGVAVGPDGVYALDNGNQAVWRITGRGAPVRVAGKEWPIRPRHGGDPGVIDQMLRDGEGSGGPATQALLCGPWGCTFDPDGNLYVAERHPDRIRRIDRRGIITTVVGPEQWRALDGPDSDGRFTHVQPRGVAVGADGSLYVGFYRGYRVCRADLRGRVTVAAHDVGENGLLAADAQGNLYIPETRAGRVLRVDPQGAVTTVAGTGAPGHSGDGGPATQAELCDPFNVACGADGSLYIAEVGALRKVDPAGIITTLYEGDLHRCGARVRAPQGEMGVPNGLAVDRAGNTYVSDLGGRCIRKIDPRGRATVLATHTFEPPSPVVY